MLSVTVLCCPRECYVAHDSVMFSVTNIFCDSVMLPVRVLCFL
jgi:hypothetical protein